MSQAEEEFAFHVKAVGLPAPVREFVFSPTRLWRFDFCWPDRMLAVEIEGGVFSQGRHTRGKGFEDDCEKYAEALMLGWRILRVTPSMVSSGKALSYVERLL